MNMTGNTILITGGGTGIGRGLAEAFHKGGNTVVIAGRRDEPLRETVAANPGMQSRVLDVGDAGSIATFAARLVADFPALDVVINNAGIMPREDLTADAVALADAEATIAINLLGPIRLTAALLPHLRRKPMATVMMVSSGLAFVPAAWAPTYSATKAAIHSYSQSLRYQLRKTSVEVIELPPPLVATDLNPGQRTNPMAMPLDAFIAEVMALLAHPDVTEVLVDRVKIQRNAQATGTYEKVFAVINPA